MLRCNTDSLRRRKFLGHFLEYLVYKLGRVYTKFLIISYTRAR